MSFVLCCVLYFLFCFCVCLKKEHPLVGLRVSGGGSPRVCVPHHPGVSVLQTSLKAFFLFCLLVAHIWLAADLSVSFELGTATRALASVWVVVVASLAWCSAVSDSGWRGGTIEINKLFENIYKDIRIYQTWCSQPQYPSTVPVWLE